MRTTGKLTIKSVDSHRNGVSGTPFAVVLFDEKFGKEVSHKVAIVFRERGSCAVLDINLLAEDNIRFGENSWRGDTYEWAMREAIEAKYGKDE